MLRSMAQASVVGVSLRVAALAALLCGCGQKGPLFLDSPSAAASAAPSPPLAPPLPPPLPPPVRP